MLRPVGFLCVVAVIGSIFTSALAKTSNETPISITISGPSTPVHSGQPIIITTVVTNITDSVISFGFNSELNLGERDFEVEVTDSQGKAVQRTDYGRAVAGDNNFALLLGAESDGPADINPNGKFVTTMNLTKMFFMNRAGVYKVLLKRHNPLRNYENIISSNALTIRVDR